MLYKTTKHELGQKNASYEKKVLSMKEFSYQARDQQGEVTSGTFEAESEEEVTERLLKNGLIPLKVEESAGDSLEKKINNYFKFGQPTLDEHVVFSHQMATMIKAGVPLIKSLNVVSQSVSNAHFRNALKDIIISLESGYNLSTTFSKHPQTFPKIYVSMAVVGENTGHLDKSFKQVARYLESEREMKRRIQSATRYPVFVLFVVFIAIMVVNVFVIPAFEGFFTSFNAPLPFTTVLLLGMSSFFENYLLSFLFSLFSLIAGFIYWTCTVEGDLIWSRVKLSFPLIGPILHKTLIGRLCRSFALMLSSGVPVLQALVIVARSTENSYMVEKIMLMRSGLERGDSLPKVAKESQIFTPLVLQMINIGEETGDMTDMLSKIADQYEQDVDYDIKKLTEVIEPLLVGIIAIMVGILGMGIFLPMWQMSSAAMQL